MGQNADKKLHKCGDGWTIMQPGDERFRCTAWLYNANGAFLGTEEFSGRTLRELVRAMRGAKEVNPNTRFGQIAEVSAVREDIEDLLERLEEIDKGEQ